MFLQEIWNTKAEAEYITGRARDYISPSDLGKAYIDRYYKMIGEIPTNHYTDRILRVFDAGREFENIVVRTMAMAGLLLSRGSRKKKNYVTLPKRNATDFECWGYYDLIIGGTPDWENAKKQIEIYCKVVQLDIDDDFTARTSLKIITDLQKIYGNKAIEPILIDVKSVNSMAFWGHNNRDKQNNFIGYPHHKLQLIPYLLGTGSEKITPMTRGMLFYVSKDDLCLQEVGVTTSEDLVEAVYKDISTMTDFVLSKTIPPKEKEIIYDEKSKKFSLNWEVGRSRYLTKIYGYKNQEEFEDKNRAKINEINLALKHLRQMGVETDLKKKSTLEKKLNAEQEIIESYQLSSKL